MAGDLTSVISTAVEINELRVQKMTPSPQFLCCNDVTVPSKSAAE